MIFCLSAGRRLKPLLLLVLLIAAKNVTAQGLYTQTNITAITINPADGSLFSTTDLYPSALTFTGIPGGESIAKITVTLSGLTLSDTNAVMASVAKQGSSQSALLFDGPGDVGNTASGLTLTFDEAAANTLPTTGGFTSGIYQPDFVNTGYNDVLPIGRTANPADPAPQIAAPNYAAGFSAFQGGNPNGTYLLFLNDFYPNSAGVLNAGWSLTIETTAVPEPSALLMAAAASGVCMGYAACYRRRRA